MMMCIHIIMIVYAVVSCIVELLGIYLPVHILYFVVMTPSPARLALPHDVRTYRACVRTKRCDAIWCEQRKRTMASHTKEEGRVHKTRIYMITSTREKFLFADGRSFERNRSSRTGVNVELWIRLQCESFPNRGLRTCFFSPLQSISLERSTWVCTFLPEHPVVSLLFPMVARHYIRLVRRWECDVFDRVVVLQPDKCWYYLGVGP